MNMMNTEQEAQEQEIVPNVGIRTEHPQQLPEDDFLIFQKPANELNERDA